MDTTRKIYSYQELQEILRLHKQWLLGEQDGKRAVLSDAVLSGADLSGAVLSGAVLSDAVLRRAVLSGADLSDAYGKPYGDMPSGWKLSDGGLWVKA